jgi:putative tryptophan/tyrosine transport system substrate-binding protein
MDRKFRIRSLNSVSHNPKSKTCTAFDKLRPRACRGEPSRIIQKLRWLTLVTMLVALGVQAQAQQTRKVSRIGYLAAGSPPLDKTFLQGLRDLGHIEGQNIVIESRFADGKHERLLDLAAELIGLKVDVIVTGGTPAAVAAKQATGTIPIVMAIVANPVGEGLVASLARPGGNVTGIANLDTELSGKRLEILKEVVPGLSRVAILWNPVNPAHKPALAESEVTARALGMQFQPVAARDPNEFKSAFSEMSRKRAGALVLLADSMFSAHRARVVVFTEKSRLPSIFWRREFVEAGGLMSYGATYPDLYRRAAYFVDRILKGAKPADLPVEQPTRFELFINLKTAKQIGLTIPPNVLARADKVIK